MAVSECTRTPWKVVPEIDGHHRLTRIAAGGKTVARTDAQCGRPHHHADEEANAALIVRAVNSHTNLLTFAKWAAAKLAGVTMEGRDLAALSAGFVAIADAEQPSPTPFLTLSPHAGTPALPTRAACGCQVRVRVAGDTTELDFDTPTELCGKGRELYTRWQSEAVPHLIAGRHRDLRNHLGAGVGVESEAANA